MATTKSNELKVNLDPRLLTQVEVYAQDAGTEIEYAVSDLLRAGLEKLAAPKRGANGSKAAKA